MILTFGASFKYFENRAAWEVSGGNYSEFPVVVLRPLGAKIVFINSDGQYEGKSVGDSFIVPSGKEERVNDWLNAGREHDGRDPRALRVTPIGDGRQLIELEIFGDGLFLSRYEATENEVKPQSLTISGPLFVFFPCGATLVIGFIAFGLLELILWFTRRSAGKLIEGVI